MSTFTRTVAAAITDDATYRAWGKSVSDGLQAIGLTKTADTGQTDWNTVLKPTAVNTVSGYEIYAFNDSRQATAPIFFKIEYATGNPLNSLSFWLTIGKGSDGAGNITGILRTRAQVSTSAALAAGSETFAAFTDGDLSLATGVQSGVNTQSVGLTINRTRNDDGTASDVGFMVNAIGTSGSAGGFYSSYAYDGSYSDQATPANAGISALAPLSLMSSYKGEVYAFPIHPVIFYWRQPITGAVLINPADAGALTTFPLTLYGTARTYRAMNSGSLLTRSFGGWGLALRYE